MFVLELASVLYYVESDRGHFARLVAMFANELLATHLLTLFLISVRSKPFRNIPSLSLI